MPRTLLGLSALAALALVLGGCASRTPVSGRFPPITPHAAQSGQYTGTTVRWGGVLIDTTPESGRTCFRVMGLTLAGDGRPQRGADERQTGRFIACAQGFYDPVLYAAGRRITFVGTITGVKREAVGGYQYPYPELAAQVVYLWPKEAPASGTVPYYGPYYWGPWGPWGADWWWSPWGYWPPAYDHDRGHHRKPPPPPPPPGGGGHAPPPAAPRPLRPGIKVQPSPSFHPRPDSRPSAPPSRPGSRPSAPPSRPPPHPGSERPSPPPSHPAPPPRPSSQPSAPPPHPGSQRPSPPSSHPAPSRPSSEPPHRPSPHARPAPARTRPRAAEARRRAGHRTAADAPKLA